MSFTSSKLLVFGLGVAAAAALSYKFTRYLFGEQRQRTDAVSSRREDSGCCLGDSCLSASSELLVDDGDHAVEDFKRLVLANLPGNTPECLAVNKTKRNGVTDDGIQCGAASSEVVSKEVQCDRASEEDKQMVIMNLKLAHTNIFMLKKHFDEELSQQIAGELKVAFFRSQHLGNYIFLRGSAADMTVGAAFCAERYDGQEVKRYTFPNELYFENSVSCMTVVGKASTEVVTS